MPPGVRLNIDKDLLIQKYTYERLNLNILAKYFNTERNTIARYLNKYNIHRHNHSRYSFNEYFFDCPNILNSYWGGFIAADGCIANKKGKNGSNYLSIGLCNNDRNQLERLKEDIRFNGPITIDNKNICKLRIFSQKICDDLNKYFSITQRKSFSLQPPTNLSDECIIAYFAGIIDGDGSINLIRSAPTISLINTESVLEWLANNLRRILGLLGSLGISQSINNKNNSIYYNLNIYKYKDVINIYKAVKELDIRVMDRKWDKIKNVLNRDNQ